MAGWTRRTLLPEEVWRLGGEVLLLGMSGDRAGVDRKGRDFYQRRRRRSRRARSTRLRSCTACLRSLQATRHEINTGKVTSNNE